MNDLVSFEFNGNAVRTVLIEGEPWWAAKDVAEVLEYSDTQAMTRRLDSEDISTCTDVSSGQGRNITIINEAGLYSAILGSSKPEAQAFKRWITHEVLPSIRKTGGYSVALPKTLPEALRAYAAVIEAREAAEAKIALMKPKAEFFDQVANSKDAIPMRQVAAVLNMPGWGRNKLFEFLRSEKILDNDNLPYREYQDRGYFRVIERSWADTKGERHIAYSTLVYQRGLEFIRKSITRNQQAIAVIPRKIELHIAGNPV